MSLEMSNIIIILAFLKNNNITKINKNKLEQLLNKCRSNPKFESLLEKIPENLEEAFHVFENWNYISPKVNELNTYEIKMKDEDVIKTLKHFSSNKNYNLYLSLTKLLIDQNNNAIELFSAKEKQKEKKIESIEEFLYFLFAMLHLDGNYYFDVEKVEETLGLSLYDTESFYNMLETSFGRSFSRKNIQEVLELFLIHDPIFPDNTMNDFVLKRRDMNGLVFVTHINLRKALPFMRELNESDFKTLETFKNQYLEKVQLRNSNYHL